MSNSVITSSQGAMSGYWNPANLSNSKKDIQIGLMHAEYLLVLQNMILRVLLKK